MIKIVTDSTAYLSEEMTKEHDIRVVPLYVQFEDESFQEGVQLSNSEFYARLKEAPLLPTTSQPSAGEFFDVFKEVTDAGNEVIALTISSKLSGTWNSAMAAKEMLPEAGISVIDSLSTSVGLQMMIEIALDAIAAGDTRQQVVDKIEAIKDRVRFLFVVDTLEYLAKGGRIGNAKALLGTLLKVKPILTLVDGAIEPFEQVRSKKKAQARLLELVESRVAGSGAQARVAIANAMVPELAAELSLELAGRLGCSPPTVAELGPVIGTHTGPGVIAVATLA